ncbi:helix-turn-helix domain-containing protein [Pseudarthrobacter sp. N5]|uniref:helix-turn-helix domain-containing protein n=1 Tax=Pseudarthrobacter sp. N5 TaxID=3418416 RepID=UPI003CE79F86
MRFASSWRRVAPGSAQGRPGFAFGGSSRRVPGLRREEVALLSGVSIDYYIRLERGNLSGVSEGVLEALSRALQLGAAPCSSRSGQRYRGLSTP